MVGSRKLHRSAPQVRFGKRRSAKASVQTPALRRAALREGVGPSTSATASGAARARLPTGCWVMGLGGRRVAALGVPAWRAA